MLSVKKITAWSHRLSILHSNASKCLSSNPQQGVNDRTREKKAINTINSFCSVLKGTVEENRPRGHTALLVL